MASYECTGQHLSCLTSWLFFVSRTRDCTVGMKKQREKGIMNLTQGCKENWKLYCEFNNA